MGSGTDGITHEFGRVVLFSTSVDGELLYLNRDDSNRKANVNSRENDWNDDNLVLLRNALHSLQSLRQNIGGIVVHQHLSPFADLKTDLINWLSNSCIGTVIQ